MANLTQTPAPSRRFVHPSSSAAQPSTTKKAAPPFSQVRASGTSASLYGRASQFSAHGPGPRDDITTSFDDVDASPSLPSRTTARLRDEDVLYDNEELPEVSRPDTGLEPKGESVSTVALNDQQNAQWHGTEFQTPMPKRRKVSHAPAAANEPIHVSSSPSDATPESSAASDGEQDGLSPAGFATPQTTSRFRASASTIAAEATRSSKPAFKATDHSSNVGTEIGAVLPEAFTPSRKKGKHDYMPGGLADTVRNWVLEVSTNEIRRGARNEREVIMEKAAVDESGRAIAAMDESGQHWLLVGSQPWSGSSSLQENVEQVKSKKRVVVRGASTSWVVPLQQHGTGSDVQVAGHWDVPP